MKFAFPRGKAKMKKKKRKRRRKENQPFYVILKALKLTTLQRFFKLKSRIFSLFLFARHLAWKHVGLVEVIWGLITNWGA